MKGDEVEKPDRDTIPKSEEEASDISSSSEGCSTLQQEVVATIWMVMVMVMVVMMMMMVTGTLG